MTPSSSRKDEDLTGGTADPRDRLLMGAPLGTPPPHPRPTPVPFVPPTLGEAAPAGSPKLVPQPIAPPTGSPEIMPFVDPHPTAPVPAPPTPAASRGAAESAPPERPQFFSVNELIVDVVSTMPTGCGFATTDEAFDGLRRAIQVDPEGQLDLHPEQAAPGFCSGATYLVFLKALQELHRLGRLPLSPAVVQALQMTSQPDGTGVWGRWNANGPGTARLFHELEMGRNFTSLDEAKAGDFVKLWWNESIGSTEKGHSAIFLGLGRAEDGAPTVSFWSSNQGVGYGEKSVPRSQIKRALISRLENPWAILHAVDLPKRDLYLSDLMKRPSSEAEVSAKVGLKHGWSRGAEPEAPALKREGPGQLAGSAGSVAPPGGPSSARPSDQAAVKRPMDGGAHRKGTPFAPPAASPSPSVQAKKPWFKKLLPL